MGGIGKTQLAVEFVHRFGSYFLGGVFWISFGDPQAIPSQVAACGRASAMDLRPDFEDLPLGEQAVLVRAAWASPYPVLLVFDNCEDEALLAQWRPKGGGAKVLVTSRRATWSTGLGVGAVVLQTLERGCSVDLLSSFAPSTEKPSLALIAEELGDLPLALHMAGAFLSAHAHTPLGQADAYLERLRARRLDHPSMTAADWSPTGHEQHVAKTFEVSFSALSNGDPANSGALSLLTVLAAYAPGEPIPSASIGIFAQEELPNEDAELAKASAIRRLANLGLIDDREGNLVLHRLVAEFLKARLPPEDIEQVRLHMLVSATLAGIHQDPRLLEPWERHLLHASKEAERLNTASASGLMSVLARHHYHQGDLKQSVMAARRRVALLERADPVDSDELSAALTELAVALRITEPLEAEKFHRRAIGILERASVPDPRSLLQGYINLAESLGGGGDTIELFSKALNILNQPLPRRAVVSADDDDAAFDLPSEWDDDRIRSRVVSGLAGALRSVDPLKSRKLIDEEIARVGEDHLGFKHVSVLMERANILFWKSDFAGARPDYERAIDLIEEGGGPDSPLLGDPLLFLGKTYIQQGQLNLAKPVLERAYRLAVRIVGAEHPNAMEASTDLSLVLTKLGDFQGAREHLEEALGNLPSSAGFSGQVRLRLLAMLGTVCGLLREETATEKHLKAALALASRDKLKNRSLVKSLNAQLTKLKMARGK